MNSLNATEGRGSEQKKEQTNGCVERIDPARVLLSSTLELCGFVMGSCQLHLLFDRCHSVRFERSSS